MDSLAASFLAWAHARGVQHDEHVTTKQSDGEGLGLIACSDLAEDLAVVTVRHVHLSPDKFHFGANTK